MARLHREPLAGITAREHPEILGDVFAWNKLFRTSFWRAQGLEWPEGVRYEDQPTTTRAFLAGTFDVVPEVVYHWRIRQDGSSITQQRASTTDLRDRWRTKRMALDAVQEYDDPATSAYFVDRVHGRRPAPLLRRDPWRLRRVVAAVGRRHPRPVGRALAGAQRPPTRAPAGRLAGRAGPPGRRGVRGAVARRPSTDPRRGKATTSSSRPPCSTSPASTRLPSPCATSSGDLAG